MIQNIIHCLTGCVRGSISQSSQFTPPQSHSSELTSTRLQAIAIQPFASSTGQHLSPRTPPEMRGPSDEICQDLRLIRGLDQGPLNPLHCQVSDLFIHDTFMENGQFSQARALAFLSRLQDQRQTIESDVQETAISEKMQTDVKNQRQARAKGEHRGLEGNADVLLGFDQFILPLAKDIAAKIAKYEEQLNRSQSARPNPQENMASHPPHPSIKELIAHQTAILGKIHEFIRGYAPYYSPNKIRTYFKNDTEVSGIIKHAIRPFKVKKFDSKAVEACNLIVDQYNQATLEKLLKKSVSVGQYLAPHDITVLKDEDFDLSLLSPGVSAYWQKPASFDLSAELASEAVLFPTPEEKVTYKGPRYRSWISTKMSATFVRDGQTHVIKIKLGEEVTGDILSSYLRRAMGFFQDKMQHREEFTMHLGDKTYQEFERDIGVKYGVNALKQSIVRRGVCDETDEEWVTFKDAAIELRPASDIRAACVDPGVYDGMNRRELRSRRLALAFLGLSDIKPTNHRLVYEQQADGSLSPKYRFQDPGSSLGTTVVLQRPRDLLRFPVSKNKIQEYDRNYISQNNKGDVSITHNDGFSHHRDDAAATYADFKWMARVIGNLTDNQIKTAIQQAGIPVEFKELYFFHIGNMKNRALKAFSLHTELLATQQQLAVRVSQVGQQSRINVPGVIKNGKIIATHVPDRVLYPRLQNTWFLFINGLATNSKEKLKASIHDQFNIEYQGLVNGLLRTHSTFQAKLLTQKLPAHIGSFEFTPGVSVSIFRVVKPNPTHFNAESEGRPYMVVDTCSVQIGVQAKIFKKLLGALTSEVAAQLQFLTMTFEHVHFNESIKDGYLTQPNIQALLFNDLDRFALQGLKPGEVIRHHWAGGIQASLTAHAQLEIPAVGGVSTRTGGTLGVTALQGTETTYCKDTWGSLHLIQEKLTQRAANIGMQIGHIDITQLAGSLASGRCAASSLSQDYYDIEVVPPHYDQNNAQAALSSYPLTETADWLSKLRSNPHLVLEPRITETTESLPDYIQLNYQVTAQRKTFSAGRQFLYAFDNAQSDDQIDFTTTSRNYEHRFHMLTRAKKDIVGMEKLALDFQMHNLLVKNGTSKKLVIEMDRENPDKFVAILDIYDYQRTLSPEKLKAFIDQLNTRYSTDNETPFFRTELPPVERDYKKIYANGRIYVDGQSLVRRLDAMDTQEFESLIRTAYETKINLNTCTNRQIESLAKQRTLKRALSQGRALQQVITDFGIENANRNTAFENKSQQKSLENKLAKAAFEFIYTLYKSKYGVALLKEVLGEDSILMIGEIYGIHQQTGMLQDDMWKSNLRFMGQSYGGGMTLNRPPIQHFIRHEQFQPPSILVQPRFGPEHFLGRIATGQAGEFIGFGNR